MLTLKRLLRTSRLPRLHFSTQAPTANKRKKITILDLKKKYNSNIPITMVTAYDYTTAKMVDESGIDMILVGDSLGMVMLGYDSTVPVTMDEMLHHSKAVARGTKSAFLVGDMPFGSYEPHEPSLAIRNALRFLKESGMDAVKIECGKEMKKTIQSIVESGIPVMGHVGLTPQRISALGGFRVQGKTVESAQKVLEDALELQEAGCFSLVIESVPEPLAQYITKKLRIPTIGIGAGKYTSGQVLVYHDMLGMYSNFTPKFVKNIRIFIA
jgi:3-methyl-2-oxobutanoate hydroxymethyltransferase